ncbi:LOW QUALITY PROTEIN: D-aminoacyl-tRNA deacylase [Leguminivora glycinivorella]|uniref:LOW QUALITY PROTEIN: D-aminoacyl-tRNA deacylase n=1 Tax=Leguminivora glycinivorella TaxID=1035111 RepID=UPI00200C5A4B|nr:LOW QUALITY PROTEIN: D-aminoacyl-tRNA deacylase [Leguminivora glycinivorella]
MKALIQRVMNAKVTVNGEVVSNIEQGLCVLIGISKNDNLKDVEYIVRKILSARLFNDDSEKRWSKSVVDKGLEVLCVSQFTLYNTWKGNKPDFHNAMAGDESKKFYEHFLQLLKKSYKSEKIKDGVFGAYMQVSIENDGPVTVSIESPVRDENTLAKENSRNPQRAKEITKCEGDLQS